MGVGLYISTEFSYKLRHDLSVFIPHVFESLFCEITFDNSHSAIIGVIYRPNAPPRADLDIFIQTFDDILQ